MRVTAAIALAWMLVAPPPLAAAERVTLVPAIRAMEGIRAGFVHRFTPKGFKTTRAETGTVLFGPAPAMRWAYAQPEAKEFVFDGSTSWLYVPSEKQVTVDSLDTTERSALPFLLLTDEAAVQRNFKSRSRVKGSLAVWELQPRQQGSPIQSISITLSTTDRMIRRLQYRDRQGNLTEFEFSSFSRVGIRPDSFRFVPPAGTEVVQN